MPGTGDSQALFYYRPANLRPLAHHCRRPCRFAHPYSPMLEDHAGQLWMGGADSQLHCFDPANPFSLRHQLAVTFCPDPYQPEQYLWVGTKGGGLNRYDRSTGRFLHLTSQNTFLPNDDVYGLLPDDAGHLWISTNRGLSRMPPPRDASTNPQDFRFRNFRAADGLQDDEFNTSAFARCACTRQKSCWPPGS